MKISVSIQPDNRLTITVGDGGVMMYLCHLGQEHIELKAVLPADSEAFIKSDGIVHVEAEKITLSGQVLSVNGSFQRNDVHKV